MKYSSWTEFFVEKFSPQNKPETVTKREVMKGVGWVEKVEADLNSELAMIGDADSQASWLRIGTILTYSVMNICVSTVQGPAGST